MILSAILWFVVLLVPLVAATVFALLASLATLAAGFLVRPFGALVFGRLGDLVGRKRCPGHQCAAGRQRGDGVGGVVGVHVRNPRG